MESGGHKSEGEGDAVHGAGGAEGALCHACGYQYPNGHPSAKQRRAHRKHCGKPASAAAEDGGAGEHEARVLFPGEVGGAAVGRGDGIGAGAAECGGGAPGSAREAGSAAADVDGTDHSSHDGAGAQVIIDKFVEDHSDIASKITPETNRTDDGGTLNDVATATQDYGRASLPEGGVSSVPASAVTSEQPQDVCVPVLPTEPGYGEGVSPELPVSEAQNSNVVSVASDATGGKISEQINDVITEPNDTTVTGVDATVNTIDKDIPVEKSAKGNDLDSSCQENLEIKVGEGHGNTTVEEDASDKNLSAVQIEEIPNDEPELNQQSNQILTSSVELVPNTEEPVKSGTQEPVGTDDFHLEATDTVKPQEQPHSISVAEDRQTVLEQTDISEGEHYPNNDEATETISSAIGPAVNADVISFGDADNMTKNVSSSDVSMGDGIKEIVTNNNVVSSQADLVVLSTSSTTHDTNMVNSTDDLEEKGQNVKSVADLTTHEINEVHTLVEDKQLGEEVVADSISHETNAVSSTDNYGENEKETIAEATSCNIPSASSIEQEKQIEEVINNPAPEKTNMTSNIDCVEEKKQIDVDVKTNRDISVLCTTEAIEEKDTTSDIKAENTTSNVEDKKQSEEIGAGDISDGTSMIYSTVNVEKMHNTEGPSFHEKIVVNSTENVEEKYEETMVDPTSHSTGIVTAIDSVEERKNDETSADLTSPGINAEHATDSVEEKKDGEAILESTSYKIETVGGTDDVKEKQKNEETTADQISGENDMAQGTYDAEKGLQKKDAATIPVSDNSLVSDKSEVTKKPDAVEGTEQKEEAAAKEINTVQSTDDLKEAGQNEEIADKEVIVDSDRSHVSLKVLLADKNVETKEKKPSTKDRVLSFRRRSSSKDNESPAKPGSPKAGSGQQDWNSPARLPAEKKPKGKKQQWVPFICCPSIH